MGALEVDDWTFQGDHTAHHYELPPSLDMRIGMRTYNGIAVSGSLKNIVVATERVGCGGPMPTPTPAPSPTPAPAPTPAPRAQCKFTQGFDCSGGDAVNRHS